MRSAEEHAHWRAEVEAATVRALQRQRRRAERSLVAAAAVRQTPTSIGLPADASAPWDPSTWDDDVQDEVGPVADDAVAAAESSWRDVAPPSLAAAIVGLGAGLASRVVDRARGVGNQLGERLASADPNSPGYADQVAGYYDGAEGQAANVGAMASQVGNTIGQGVADAAAGEGFSMTKVWNTVGDDQVRPSHEELEGMEIDAGDIFDNGCMFPGDPDGDPSETEGCRCWLEFNGFGTETAGPDVGAAMGEAAADGS